MVGRTNLFIGIFIMELTLLIAFMVTATIWITWKHNR
jgi:hypothetical protein